jgi:hypothetical protein
VSKTTALLDQAQPFLRDQYSTVRKELGPRIAHTRDVAVPIAMDVSHRALDASNKVRNDYLPVATKRASLAAAALRGDDLKRAHERRVRWGVVAAVTAAGAAALGAGAYVWQRKRNADIWYEDTAEDTAPAADDAPIDPAKIDNR